MRNRNDDISVCAHGGGVRCECEHTRRLHLCAVFPITGSWLLRKSQKDHPIRLQSRPQHVSETLICQNESGAISESPQVSFLIGHKGKARLPHLLATLKSIAAQAEVSFECIVIEQNEEIQIKDALPDWAIYLHAPHEKSGALYNRSRAFNDGARMARGDVLILHDNDMLVPMDYAVEACRKQQAGFEVAQLKRFVFYLNEVNSKQISDTGSMMKRTPCDYVIQNLCGGGSVAISRQVYWDIGGMDEDFIGWGGEDQEFWDRSLTRKVWEYGGLPIVHLWHAAQSGKRVVNGMGAHTADLTKARRALSPEARINRLHEICSRKKAYTGEL